MFRYFLVRTIIVMLALFVFSCSSANNKPILINFSADSTAIVFSGIDEAGLNQLRNTPGIDTAYQHVLAVLQTPGENDSTGRERMLEGRIKITDSTIIFNPAQPFVKGKQYMVTSYMNVKFGGAQMAFKGRLNAGLQPSQVMLSR